ncbi:MAG: DUF1566 domain-containing protein [Prevotellaceae bacterium]|nr:DUF1566 domain-containing protein [Prevotellaceae bacterium]
MKRAQTFKINGHEYIDLGLKVKWATCNVGALSSSDYGNYYAWGETSPKSSYTADNCTTYGKVMDDISGNTLYDAARANWGGTWRMPTRAEMYELFSKCQWEWAPMDGLTNGYKVIGPNGNSIFLPAAAWCFGGSLHYAGDYGYYWSSTPDASNTPYAYTLHFNRTNISRRWSNRSHGRSIRPVSD